MELTFIGVIQLAVGLVIVLAGSLRHAFAFLLVSGLFGGGAAIALPALGGSSIPPMHFACLFVYLCILAPRGGFIGMLPATIRANAWLVAYTLYGIASAIIAPRLFAGEIYVAPLRGDEIVPLGPNSQNITSSIYMLGTLAIAIASYVVCSLRGGAATLISTAIVVGWLNVFLGVATALAADTPLSDFFELFRNGNYTQHDQSFGEFTRIRGLFPESSAFVAFGFAYFVLSAELWYRSIRPVATGSLALGIAVILFFSTSSTAYLGLAAYLAFFTLRVLTLPDLAPGWRIQELAVTTFILVALVIFAFLLSPTLLASIIDMVEHMTVKKSESPSAQERLFWAMQGWEAFKVSYGLGIGAGSFRSSSLILAMMGSAGAIGLVTFAAYLLQVLQPGRRSTYARTADLGHSVGGAFATASVLTLLPACVSSPSADPGANFAFFAGAALALRPPLRRRDISTSTATSREMSPGSICHN